MSKSDDAEIGIGADSVSYRGFIPGHPSTPPDPVRMVPLVEELVIEAGIVPARRGELYAAAANRIRELEAALHAVIDCDDIRTARSTAHSVLPPQ